MQRLSNKLILLVTTMLIAVVLLFSGLVGCKFESSVAGTAVTSNEVGNQVPSLPPASAQPTSTPTENDTSPSDLPSDDLIGLIHSDPAYIDNSGISITPVGQLHITGSAPVVDITKYNLTIDGLVDNPLTLNYEDLMQYPATTQTVLLICQDVFVDNASWTGVPLATLLTAAQVKTQASLVAFHALDGYAVTLTLKDAQRDGVFLAYKVDGQTLPKEHGYPLRLVLKGMYGSNWIKWVDHIEVK